MPRNVELDHDETMTPHVRSITLVRHGRTAYNLARRLQGQIDIPLDIVGRWQADQSAYELAKTYYWAKVAHLAEHNDQLAQPAYGNAHLADVDEINNAPAACSSSHRICSARSRPRTPSPTSWGWTWNSTRVCANAASANGRA